MRKLRSIGARWRVSALIVLALLSALLIWYFLLREAPGQQAANQPPPSRPALGQSVGYEEYISAVDSALGHVREARAASGDEQKRGIEDALAALEEVEGGRVTPPTTGSLAEVDNTHLTGALRADDPDLEGVESSLALLTESLRRDAAASVPGTRSGEEAEATLREVLSDPAFDYERGLSPLQRLARWLAGMTGEADPDDTLWRWFAALMAGIAAGALTFLASERLGSRWLRLGMAALAGLAVGVLFYFGLAALGQVALMVGALGMVVAAVAALLLALGVHTASAPSSATRQVSDLAAALGMSASEAREKAQEAASAGELRSAIRYRCLAVLLALDEVGMLHFDRAATNREYLFRAPGDLQNDLEPLLARFDSVWYGGAPVSQEEWQEYSDRANRIEVRAIERARRSAA